MLHAKLTHAWVCLNCDPAHRKYRSLEVRYSRLRQGPMRFTFTAEGENVEEEEWKEDGERDDSNDKDEDEKPLT